jgi:hypothetical protein
MKKNLKTHTHKKNTKKKKFKLSIQQHKLNIHPINCSVHIIQINYLRETINQSIN